MTELKRYIDRFHPISNNTWDQVNVLFVEKELAKEEYFIRENQHAKQVAFLKSGIIRAFFRKNDGKEYNKHFFQKPSFFGGYSSLITGEVNLINQQALTDCSLLVADYSKFCKLFETCLDLEIAARKLAELNFVDKENRELELVLLSAQERYLLMQKRFPDLEQHVAQYHIASYLGVTPTQLSRIRKNIAQR